MSAPNNSVVENRKDNVNAFDEKDALTYHSFINCLLYIAIKTRPNLCFAARSLSLRLVRPCSHHMGAVKRVLRCLTGTSEHRVKLKRGGVSQLREFVDLN